MGIKMVQSNEMLPSQIDLFSQAPWRTSNQSSYIKYFKLKLML
jgi:hypothetical protein